MAGLANYLHEFGWRPVILTPPLERRFEPDPRSMVVLETAEVGDTLAPLRTLLSLLGIRQRTGVTDQIKARLAIPGSDRFIDRMRSLYLALTAIPDTEIPWKPAAISTATDYLRNHRVDAMVSVWPWTCHLVAHELKKTHQIPWIVDFVDPWSLNHNYPYFGFRRLLDRRLELKTVSSADALTAAAPAYAAKEESLHRRRTESIPLGFDPELTEGQSTPLSTQFTITYTGTIYSGKQDPLKLLAAAQELVGEGRIAREDLSIRFYGTPQRSLDSTIEDMGLQDVAKQYGMVSKGEAAAVQRESQVLLLLGWEDPDNDGVYPLKTFEYLGARRPILVTGGFPSEDVKRIVREANAGAIGLDVADIKDMLLQFYTEYQTLGAVSYRGTEEIIGRYSYRTMAERFAHLLDNTTDRAVRPSDVIA